MAISDDILTAMDVYGGSFVKELAKLYRVADWNNRKRLERCFEDVFLEYRYFAERMKENAMAR